MVDFGVTKKPTLQARLAARAATIQIKEVAAPSLSDLIYFHASFPSTTFILPSGRRFAFGREVANWYITKDQEEIKYLRDNFTENVKTSIKIKECTQFDYDADIILRSGIIGTQRSSTFLMEKDKK